MQPNLSDSAKNTMVKKGYNCSQAIFATYGERPGLGKVDYDTCLKISSAFGGVFKYSTTSVSIFLS